jgi:hypothetical protein
MLSHVIVFACIWSLCTLDKSWKELIFGYIQTANIFHSKTGKIFLKELAESIEFKKYFSELIIFEDGKTSKISDPQLYLVVCLFGKKGKPLKLAVCNITGREDR